MSIYDVQDRCRERYDAHVGEFRRVWEELYEVMDGAEELLEAYDDGDAVVGMDAFVEFRSALKKAECYMDVLLSQCVREGHNRGELWS